MSAASGHPSTADVIILGAGVNGASIAFHLARRKAGRVVVIDKATAGEGGSGRSSALVRMHYTLPEEVRLALKSHEYFTHWPEIVGRPSFFKEIGFIRLVAAHDVEAMKRNVAMHRELGADARIITAAEVKAIEPEWRVDDFEWASYEPHSGYGDGGVVANDFLDRAREMGAVYLPRTRVTGLSVDRGRVRGVETEGGRIEAPLVVAAIGPWSKPLLRTAGLDLPIEPEFHRVAILQNPPGMKGGGVACIDSILNIYYRSEGPGKTLVGEFYGPRDVDPDTFPQSVPEEDLLEMALGVAKRIPKLEEGSVARAVTGVYDMSPDQRPLLGPVPGVQGLHVAAGFSGMGFKIAPAVGLTMSELLLDGAGRTVDLSIFDPGRFAAGRPIKAPHEYADE
jgi:glycine/D-amino acid oxidase-like deaminating enzyme